MFKQLFALLLLAAVTNAAPSVTFSNYSMPSMNVTNHVTNQIKVMVYSEKNFSEYCSYIWDNATPSTAGANLSLYGGSVFASSSHAATENNSNDGFNFTGLKPDTYIRTCWIRTLDNQTFVSGTRILTVSTYAGQPSSSDMMAISLVVIGSVLLYISFGAFKL